MDESGFAGQSRRINTRAREFGEEILERAHAARARCWHRAFYLDGMVDLLDLDPTLRTRAFEFVDCLPALKTDADLVDHLGQYLNPQVVKLPHIANLVLSPGRFRDLVTPAMGWAARFGAVQMASRFITGYDIPSVVKTLRRLRRRGMGFTLDVLGEFTTSDAQADRYAEAYHALLDSVPKTLASWPEVPRVDRDRFGPMPRVNVSIKLSSLDPWFDPINWDGAIERVARRLRPLLRKAMRVGAFVNVDLESFKYRDISFELFRRVLMEDEFRGWSNVGVVVQAYLRDSEADLRSLLQWGRRRGGRFAIRLVKGAYWDAETAAAVRAYADPPVWTRKWQSDAQYERLSAIMLDHVDVIRPCFASHNVRSLAVVMALAEERKLGKADYETQMLFGMGDPLKDAVAQMGHALRVYCPYGDLMPGMGYLIRRLLENTSNDGFLKQGFGDRASYPRMLADPAIARPPSASLPKRLYRNTDAEEPMFEFKNAATTNFAKAENRERMIGALAYVRGELGRPCRIQIGGETYPGSDVYESVNPSRPDELVGRVSMGSKADIDRAVGAAGAAYVGWRASEAVSRAAVLRRAADRLEMRRFELAATMILEVGKPWREADADVVEAIDHCRYYADQIEWIEAHPRLRNIPGENNSLVYTPRGVCAVIAPWSFPLAILTGMTTAALAAGNTVVIKPAPQSSVIASKLVEVLTEAGLPEGVANFVPGHGDDIGRHLVTHPGVKIVAFTGSSAVGSEVLAHGSTVSPGQDFIRKMIVEMGGKNAIIVDDDADLDAAVQAIIESAFSYAGQKCSSCSRVIATSGVYELLLTRLREAASSIVIGSAEDPGTMVGPVIDAAARDRILPRIEQARREFTILFEGRVPGGVAGVFVPPVIFQDVDADSALAQDELFGPVLSLFRARDFDHALELANRSRYALTGGLFSRNPAHIERAWRDFAAGNLYINRRITGSQVDVQPFGGFKLSGTGVKAGSPDYLLHFMDARCITENTQRSGLVPDELQRGADGSRLGRETD